MMMMPNFVRSVSQKTVRGQREHQTFLMAGYDTINKRHFALFRTPLIPGDVKVNLMTYHHQQAPSPLSKYQELPRAQILFILACIEKSIAVHNNGRS
jgi:hypothetical protein